jgi:hypothetical protein
MDEWQMHLVAVYLDAGLGEGRKLVELIVDVRNVGATNSGFIGYPMLLRDAQGRTYEWDQMASWVCKDMLGLESGGSMNPGQTARVCVAYDVPLDARSFTTSPVSIVGMWQGGFAFELP